MNSRRSVLLLMHRSVRLLVTVEEVAHLLSVSPQTIRNLVAAGTLEVRGRRRLRRVTMVSLGRYAAADKEEVPMAHKPNAHTITEGTVYTEALPGCHVRYITQSLSEKGDLEGRSPSKNLFLVYSRRLRRLEYTKKRFLDLKVALRGFSDSF